MRRSRRMSFTLSSYSAAPPGAFAARVDVHVRSAGVPARVNAEAAYEVRMLQLDDLDREANHATVDGRVPPVAVRVDRDIRRVTVLVLAVFRRPLDAPVVVGSA